MMKRADKMSCELWLLVRAIGSSSRTVKSSRSKEANKKQKPEDQRTSIFQSRRIGPVSSGPTTYFRT